jgi:hypothetical protein
MLVSDVYPEILCEEVIVDDEDNILTEAAIRQYKRDGKKIIKKFRCLAGPKKGKLASSASDCTKRKDPKKVRQGRKIMRSKKGTIKRKSAITKRTSISKIVARMNWRLMGKG